MNETFKSLFWLYQRSMFYAGLAFAEARKPLTWSNEALLVMTFLAVRGIETSIWKIVVIYCVLLVLSAIGGKFLVWSGVIKYNTRINNLNNPELCEILERVKRIEGKLWEL